MEYRSGASDFHVVVRQTAMGLPAWLIYNQVQVRGTPPPFDDRYMPEGSRYAPGIQALPRKLAIAAAGLLVSSTVLHLIVLALVRFWPRGWALFASYGSVAAIACGSGLALASNPDDIAPAALIGVLVVLPTATAFWTVRTRQYVNALGLAAIGVAVLWWTARMADHLNESHGYRDAQVGPDLIVPALGVALYTGIACMALLVAQTTARRN